MDPIICALGHNGSYYFESAANRFWHNLPKEIDVLLEAEVIQSVYCAALGSKPRSYFFNLQLVGGQEKSYCGEDCPEAFKQWLRDEEKLPGSRKHTRVTFGPWESFIAWSQNSFRWSKLPEGLETTIQDWLCPAGWRVGPPTQISIGANGSVFAVSKSGEVVLYTANKSSLFSEEIASWKAESSSGLKDVKAVYLSPASEDTFVVIFNSTFAHFSPGQRSLAEGFIEFAKSFAAPGILRYYQTDQERLEEREKKRKMEQLKRIQRENKRQELRLQFAAWKSNYRAHVQHGVPFKAFPFLPATSCTCKDVGCVFKKKDSGLRACQHDVDQFLRTSGLFSVEWHPDLFGQRCAPEQRAELQKLSSELYSIYNNIIADEERKT